MKNSKNGSFNEKVMKNSDLPIQSKAIFAYLSSRIGEQESASITVKEVTEELGMCRQTFNKYRACLIDAGIIEVTKTRKPGGGVMTVYKLTSE